MTGRDLKYMLLGGAGMFGVLLPVGVPLTPTEASPATWPNVRTRQVWMDPTTPVCTKGSRTGTGCPAEEAQSTCTPANGAESGARCPDMTKETTPHHGQTQPPDDA